MPTAPESDPEPSTDTSEPAEDSKQAEKDHSDPERDPGRSPTAGAPPGDTPGEAPGNRSGSERHPRGSRSSDAHTASLRDAEDRAGQVSSIARLLLRWELGTVFRLGAPAAVRSLSLREFLVLAELSRRPFGLANAQVCGITGFSSATVTELLRGLRRRDLVDRGRDPYDGRQVNSAVTDAGHDLLGDLLASAQDVEFMAGGAGPDQLAAVTVFLRGAGDRAYDGSRRIRDRMVARW